MAGSIDFTPFEDGEAITAANMTSRFTELVTGLNALNAESVERESLRSDHVPAISFSSQFSGGYMAVAPEDVTSGGAYDTYQNSLPVTQPAGPTYYPTLYQTFSAAAPSAPYGPPGALDRAGGWRIVAFQNASADAAEVTLDTTTDLATDGITGLLVRGAVELRDADDFPTGLGAPQRASVYIAIGWEDGVGTRHVIERSVRNNSIPAVRRGDLVTSAFIDTDLLDTEGGDGQVSSVFLVIAGGVRGDITGDAEDTTDPEIRYYNLSVVPVKAGAL